MAFRVRLALQKDDISNTTSDTWCCPRETKSARHVLTRTFTFVIDLCTAQNLIMMLPYGLSISLHTQSTATERQHRSRATYLTGSRGPHRHSIALADTICSRRMILTLSRREVISESFFVLPTHCTQTYGKALEPCCKSFDLSLVPKVPGSIS